MTDAEGYTSLAERMDPMLLVEFVNRYFQALFAAILANGGAVLDVKGDGLLAVWTSDSPDIRMRALVCGGCLQILEAAERFNCQFPASRLPTRIGVDFGAIVLAEVGAFARYEYRAIGDPVNTSSRLEQLNKQLGTRLLVSQHLAEGVEGFVFRDLGYFALPGKRSHLRVFELVAERVSATQRQFDICRAFAPALAAYEAGRLSEAAARFGALGERYPEDGPARFYLERCAERQKRAELSRASAGLAPAGVLV